MVAKDTRDRRSSLSVNATSTSTKTSHEKKKVAKPIGICGFCLGNNRKNASGISEKMINCAECGNSGHPSCLQYSEKLVEKIRTIRWQCIDCKRCIVCEISDDSLLFCDLCDSGVHPKCCDPPLDSIPKGDFICHVCFDETKQSPKKTLLKRLSSTRSHRSNGDDSPVDEISNFFLPNKPKTNHLRQQSVQKAMKYLRDKKTHKPSNKKLLKRLHSTNNHPKENHLLTQTILASSKTSTPLLNRQSSKNRLLPAESMTTPSRVGRRSDVHLDEEVNKSISSRSITKRKHSTNSISPISTNSSIIIKKRPRNESPTKKHPSKKKQKECESDEEQSDDDESAKRKLHIDFSKYKNPPAFLKDALPSSITENDIYLFLESRKNSAELQNACSEKYHHLTESTDDDSTNNRWPPYIVFGTDLIKTWYSSSYPQEYARVPRLYICEFCLKYMKCEQVYDRHRKKCTVFHPPANEIYHKDDLSVFEVDGNINRIYCQNLCLLAKLFLDHKTLYYDVEPFLFYVLTKNDANGCHFLGYFSKEKHCPQKYNLSCITVLPRSQRRGYGRFLIELSYLISQKEGQMGTPERPLSTLGAQTYEAYWKIKIVEQLIIYHHEKKEKCLLKTIMNETGMAVDDVIETLQNLGVLTMKSNKKPVITADMTQLENIIKIERIRHAHWVSIDSEYLRFTPVLTPLALINEERAVEKEVKEIQIVFKEIGREAAEAAAALAADESNSNEGVRYIRRRKFGHKRRSIIVKRRTPMQKQSFNRSESMMTNDDSCTADIIANYDDEHSQEYVPRRRISIINEPIKETEGEEENQTIPLSLSPKVSLKQPVFKQLKLDQFLKVVQTSPTVTNEDNSQTNHSHSETNNDITPTQTRRITRQTRLHSTSQSDTDPIKIENGHQESKTDGDLSPITPSKVTPTMTTNSLHSLLIASMDRPIPLKRRSLTSSNILALIDEACTPPKSKTDIIPTMDESHDLINNDQDKKAIQSNGDEQQSPNHCGYPTRSKQQLNLDNGSCSSATTMDYIPFYPSTESMDDDSSSHQSYYSSNDINTLSCNGNGTTSFAQSSSTTPTTTTTQRN